ncbi:MAG: hypothetical protein H6797_02775 [Candidatus Nomurabacteria bacterium]|nr:MAG: hypothetical protein H6797_02775 [Candidatus Nomurabacteria bacterium]
MNRLFRGFFESIERKRHYKEVARTFRVVADQLETFSIKAEQVTVVAVPYYGKPDTALLCYLERHLGAEVNWDISKQLLIARR